MMDWKSRGCGAAADFLVDFFGFVVFFLAIKGHYTVAAETWLADRGNPEDTVSGIPLWPTPPFECTLYTRSE
jgi:hypothetical protein